MSDLLARLIADGTSPDLVAEVAMLLAERQVLDNRRAGERRRKQEQRERQKGNECHVTSRDVTGQTVTSQDEPALPLPPNENNSNPPTPTHPDGDTPRTRKAHRFPVEFPRPDWAEPAVWADLLKNRKAKRLPNTGTAHEQFVAAVVGMADPEWPPGRLLKAIVARGWGGAYDPREKRNDRHVQKSEHPDAWRGSAGRSQPDPRDGFTIALQERAFGANGPPHG